MALTKKEIFNALNNAEHIMAYQEEKVKFTVLHFHQDNHGKAKAVVRDSEGKIRGLFTDAGTAIEAFQELLSVFGDDQPEIMVKQVQTAKGSSVYRIEVC